MILFLWGYCGFSKGLEETLIGSTPLKLGPWSLNSELIICEHTRKFPPSKEAAGDPPQASSIECGYLRTFVTIIFFMKTYFTKGKKF